MGADARFAAKEAGTPIKGTELSTIRKSKFVKLVDKVKTKTPEELADSYNIEFTDAETLNIALLVYQELLNYTKAKEIIVTFLR